MMVIVVMEICLPENVRVVTNVPLNVVEPVLVNLPLNFIAMMQLHVQSNVWRLMPAQVQIFIVDHHNVS